MRYMKLDTDLREEFLASLAGMPEFLMRAFSGLTAEQTRTAGRDGTPCPVEQKISLCDIQGFMFQHDTAHRTEIEAWKASVTQ
jgi:hypothetical protein